MRWKLRNEYSITKKYRFKKLATGAKKTTIQNPNTVNFIRQPQIKKYRHDELQNGSLTVFKPLLNIIAPNFLKIVLYNDILIQSLDSQEKNVLQLIIDNKVYNMKNDKITGTKGQVIALFFLDRVIGEMTDLKKEKLYAIISQVQIKNALDIIAEINVYIDKDRKYFKEKRNSSSYLEQIKEYCLDVIGVNTVSKEYEEFVENDPRLSHEILQTIVKRRTIRNINFEDKSITIPSNPLVGLFQDKTFSDVKLNVNGYIVKCHKTILASSSLYFETLFSGVWNEVSKIEEIYPEEIIFIIKYCYGIIETIPSHLIIPVIKKAHEHDMMELVNIAFNQLVITVDNFFDIVQSLFNDIEEEM